MPRSTPLFRSAFGPLDTPTPDELLAFHRQTFGGARMENDPAPAAPITPAPTATPPLPGPPPVTPPAGERQNGPNGFPENTPVAEMTETQRAAYGQHMREQNRQRREEFDAATGGRSPEEIRAAFDELDRLRRAGMSDTERALDEARSEARRAAERETSDRYQSQLVRAEVRAALAVVRFPHDRIDGQVEFIDHSKFLTPTGEVDTDKVKQYAASLAPAGGHWPDMGGGDRGVHTRAKGVSAGADMFAASRGKKSD